MINWQGYNWIPREDWGEIHPDKTFCWYDPTALKIDDDDSLHLYTHKNPRYFPEFHLRSEVGVGLISCETKFKYGSFEIEAKLPSGPIGVWPAFWLWGADTWPPEIDIFEGFGNYKGNYLKFDILSPFGFYNVRPTLHCGNSKENYSQVKSRQPFFGFKNPAKNYIKYALDWREDYIMIYYNGVKIKEYTDENILKWFRKPMTLILNNHISSKTDPNNCYSDFHILKLKISQ